MQVRGPITSRWSGFDLQGSVMAAASGPGGRHGAPKTGRDRYRQDVPALFVLNTADVLQPPLRVLDADARTYHCVAGPAEGMTPGSIREARSPPRVSCRRGRGCSHRAQCGWVAR